MKNPGKGYFARAFLINYKNNLFIGYKGITAIWQKGMTNCIYEQEMNRIQTVSEQVGSVLLLRVCGLQTNVTK
jgi:hypothetical protein